MAQKCRYSNQTRVPVYVGEKIRILEFSFDASRAHFPTRRRTFICLRCQTWVTGLSVKNVIYEYCQDRIVNLLFFPQRRVGYLAHLKIDAIKKFRTLLSWKFWNRVTRQSLKCQEKFTLMHAMIKHANALYCWALSCFHVYSEYQVEFMLPFQIWYWRKFEASLQRPYYNLASVRWNKFEFHVWRNEFGF